LKNPNDGLRRLIDGLKKQDGGLKKQNNDLSKKRRPAKPWRRNWPAFGTKPRKPMAIDGRTVSNHGFLAGAKMPVARPGRQP
jgi:hypothetical protein